MSTPIFGTVTIIIRFLGFSEISFNRFAIYPPMPAAFLGFDVASADKAAKVVFMIAAKFGGFGDGEPFSHLIIFGNNWSVGKMQAD